MKFISLLFLSFASLVMALKPTKDMAVLDAFVSDFDDRPYKGKTVQFRGQTSGKVIEGTTDAQGQFSVLIPKGDTYDIEFITLTGPYKCDEIAVPLKAGRGNVNVQFDDSRFELRNVLFDTGKATLRPESFKELGHLAEGLRKNDTLKVEIAGHTDNVGGEQYNLDLSQARANTVMEWLTQKGIPASRLTARGYGYTEPVADNSTESGRAQNRRTEVRVLNLNRE